MSQTTSEVINIPNNEPPAVVGYLLNSQSLENIKEKVPDPKLQLHVETVFKALSWLSHDSKLAGGNNSKANLTVLSYKNLNNTVKIPIYTTSHKLTKYRSSWGVEIALPNKILNLVIDITTITCQKDNEVETILAQSAKVQSSYAGEPLAICKVIISTVNQGYNEVNKTPQESSGPAGDKKKQKSLTIFNFGYSFPTQVTFTNTMSLFGSSFHTINPLTAFSGMVAAAKKFTQMRIQNIPIDTAGTYDQNIRFPGGNSEKVTMLKTNMKMFETTEKDGTQLYHSSSFHHKNMGFIVKANQIYDTNCVIRAHSVHIVMPVGSSKQTQQEASPTFKIVSTGMPLQNYALTPSYSDIPFSDVCPTMAQIMDDACAPSPYDDFV